MTDVLCIGTTGMLAGCVRSLIAQGHRVACLARTPARLDALVDSLPSADQHRLSTHPCDYRDLPQLARMLDALPFTPTGAICWIHSPAEPVLDMVESRYPPIDLLRVISSSTTLPDGPHSNAMRTVRLGFVIDGDRSRWLSDDEISRGVYDAYVSNNPDSIVGVIEPWDRRP